MILSCFGGIKMNISQEHKELETQNLINNMYQIIIKARNFGFEKQLQYLKFSDVYESIYSQDTGKEVIRVYCWPDGLRHAVVTELGLFDQSWTTEFVELYYESKKFIDNNFNRILTTLEKEKL